MITPLYIKVTPTIRLLPALSIMSSIPSSPTATSLGCHRLYQDLLIGHGRHFGRTIHTLCRIHAVINNGLIIEAELINGGSEQALTKRFKYKIYHQILTLTPTMEDRINSASEEELLHIPDLLQKGASGIRPDDTQSLKSVIIDWITPKGQSLTPPLSRNIKIDRGFHHEHTSTLLCPTGLDWDDPEGAFKHIFMSPSSVEKENKATRSGNARIHGMTSVTPASIAYVATQVGELQVFPGHEEQACRSANPKIALAHIKARRAVLKLVGQVSGDIHGYAFNLSLD
ncbi:hypothetical protein DXG01_009429 [Tephrocybe rancida]|nr:hypothetical protein DXG01_009429 [Tephrocybe rancida]